MIYRLVTFDTAESHILSAYNWYEDQRLGLGDEFLLELTECYKRIIDLPYAYPVKVKHYRQALLRRFPFAVFYEIVEPDIIIHSVFHTRRNPSKKFRKS